MHSARLTPVSKYELQVGKPIGRSIYNANGDLLLSLGYVIENESQIESLLESGFFKQQKRQDDPRYLEEGRSKAVPAGGNHRHNGYDSTQGESRVAFDEVRWQIGETFFLHQQGSSTRYTTRLIGFVKNGSILVTMPVVEDKYVLIRDAQLFILRAFSGKKAYAFSAFVMKTVHAPHPYLHLSYPREITCATIRHRVRIPVSIIASISIDGLTGPVAGVLVDMSLGGAAAVIKHPYGEIGQRGRLKFKVNAIDEPILMDMSAILRSIVPLEDGKGCKHGYEFSDLSPHDRLVLSAFFHQAEGNRG
jgi:c-di-GMP-binding flagellar brake protein YcgR